MISRRSYASRSETNFQINPFFNTLLGVRYAMNSRSLPGTPDLVFLRLRKVIFVHGCFWHGHTCPMGRQPSSRRDYWIPKLDENRRRDRRKQRLLKKTGWKSLVVWQCQLNSREALVRRLSRFLEVQVIG